MRGLIDNSVNIGGNQTITGAKKFTGAITGTTATFSGAITGTTAGNSTNNNTIASTKFVKNVCNTSGAGIVTWLKAGTGFICLTQNGPILQWGNAAQTGTSTRTVTLPTPFTSTGYKETFNFYGSNGEVYAGSVDTKTTTNFVIHTVGGANSQSAEWIAAGF